jgi:DNA-binding NarL/FixJ family response regulator
MGSINVVIIDDAELYRKEIPNALLEYDIITLGVAANGIEGLNVLKEVRPDVVMLDLEMPLMDGSATFDLIKELHPTTKVLILSQYDEDGIVENYMHRGAHGYLPKIFVFSNFEVLAEAIKAIVDCKKFFYQYNPNSSLKYTKRETKIIPMLIESKTSKEIGAALGIDEKQVSRVRNSLYKKTNSRNATEFMKYCLKKGLEFLGRK